MVNIGPNVLANMPLAANHGPDVGTTMCMFCKANLSAVFLNETNYRVGLDDECDSLF
jgi:hypothetical protein